MVLNFFFGGVSSWAPRQPWRYSGARAAVSRAFARKLSVLFAPWLQPRKSF